jgi:ketosteroid isomerase-like protein
MSDAGVEELVRSLYPALAAGEADTVRTLLAEDFEGRFAEGLPYGLGGPRDGREAMIAGWWEIGRRFAIRAEPSEWIPCEDGRLLVRGRYLGKDRATSRDLDAAMFHLWGAGDGLLMSLEQLTDTALWVEAAR